MPAVSEVIREALRDWSALRPQRQAMPSDAATSPKAGTAADILVQQVRPICERHAIDRLWLCGNRGFEFVVEFPGATEGERRGKWAMLTVELEMLLGERVRLIDLEQEVDPDFIRHFERSRRLLFSASV